MTRPCRWAREQLYINPNHMQALAIRAAALAQTGAQRRGERGRPACSMGNYPTLNVDRHLRNFHWKTARGHRPLPRGAAESRRAARQADPGRRATSNAPPNPEGRPPAPRSRGGPHACSC